MTMELPHGLAPMTCRLLRDLFGRHLVQVLRPDAPEGCVMVEAGLLALDHARLLMSGGTKLPVLVLVSPDGRGGRTYLSWLRRVMGVPVHWHRELVSMAQQVGVAGLHVYTGAATTELATLLDMTTANTVMNLAPPLTHEPMQLRVEAHHALLLDREPPEGVLDHMHHWLVRPTAVHWADHRDAEDVMHESYALLNWLRTQPLYTRPEHHTWFHPPLLVAPNA